MNTQKMLEEYKACVDICSRIDYEDKKTINDNNKAVKRMYSILRKIKGENEDDIKYFYPLLENEMTGKWFSHQLLELFQVDTKIEKRALKIITGLSKKELGEKYWLDNYKKKKKRGIFWKRNRHKVEERGL
ncbi:MAG: hypothetical protein LBK44_01245 [Spirochaetales bacterium]|jgi:hypothetical protein|nr:hypothetical protein [Spirochaetales bacterium]